MDLRDAKTNGTVLREHYKRSAWVRSLSAAVTKELVGQYYGEEASTITNDPASWAKLAYRPNNLLNQFFMSLRPHLAGEQIGVSVSPLSAGLDGEAAVVQLAMDVETSRMGLARTHGKVVDLALVSGCAAYHICRTDSPQRITIRDEDVDPGMLTINAVGIDDLILDTTSRSREEDCIRAARFRQSRQYLMESGIFDPKLVEKMRKVRDLESSETAGDSDDLAIDSTSGEDTDDLVEGWNVVIRRGSNFYVGVRNGMGEGEEDAWLVEPYLWDGPGDGPIEVLNLISVPGQAVGMSPLWQAIDIHLAKQHIGSKMVALMMEANTKIVYNGPQGEKVAEDLRDPFSRNIKGDPSTVKDVNIPGPTGDMYNSFEWLAREANNEAMSLSQLSGSEAPSKLATGIAAVQASLASRVGLLSGRATAALQRVMVHILDDLYNDPMPRDFVGGTGTPLEVPYRIDASNKRGKPSMFKLDVTPFSPENSDPNARRARFAEFIQLGVPFIAQVAQLGGNVQTAQRMLSKQYNDPMIDDLFPSAMGQQLMMAQQATLADPRGGIAALQTAGPSETAQGQQMSDMQRGQPQPAGAA